MKLILIFLALSILTLAHATDLVVQDNGPTGTYSSIQAAVTAAVDGDRIIINNKLSGLPWVEDITIDKSLTFLCAVDNQRFLVQGDYTIAPAPGREVSIIGMENSDGQIKSQSSGTTSRTIVNVFWCKLNSSSSGSIIFNSDYFDVNVASCELRESVSIRYGSVIGNYFPNRKSIGVGEDILPSNDTVFVVGNKNCGKISAYTSSHYVYISNNFIYQNASSNGAIGISKLKSGSSDNILKNNALYIAYAPYAPSVDVIAIDISAPTGILNIYNNLIVGTSDLDEVFDITGATFSNLIIYYNYTNRSFGISPLSGTNYYSSTIGLNSSTGASTSSLTTNGGNPGIIDYDLDLTRNDAGCYGGSYTLDNFHPIDGTSSRVYFLKMPVEIITGQPNGVTGFSFDR